MRIGVFVDAYEPHTSGVTTSVNMLKMTLENMGHTVYIVTANLVNNKFIYDEENRIIWLPGIKLGLYDFKLTSFYSPRAMKIIKTWNLDIIHSQTEFAVGHFSRTVAKKLGLPVVHTYHTLYEDYVYYITHGHFDNFAKKMAINLTKKYCDKTCDQCIVPTQKIKDLFINKYGITKNLNVIPTGIDTDKFIVTPEKEKKIQAIKKKYKISDDDFVIGAVGRIAKEKSFDRMITAAYELAKINPKIKVFIVGGGPDLENIQELVKNLHAEKSVILTGKVDYSEVDLYYHVMNVMCSFSSTETQGLTIIEGLACSIPIVCLNDDSFKVTIESGYNGYLFDTDEQFREQIGNLIANKKEYKEMCKNAKNSIYIYTKEVFGSELLKVYSKAKKVYEEEKKSK